MSADEGHRAHVVADGPVLVVTLDRPARRNAVDARMGAAVAAGIARLGTDDALRVGVLAGGPPDFSVGFDLATFTGDDDVSPFDEGFLRFLAQPPAKPLVAAVDGMAVGAGFEMVLACDLVVAGESARFALPEVKRGLVAGGGGLLRLGRRIPANEATALALTGAWLTARRAHELGLVHALVPDGTAAARAVELARDIASNAPLAVAASKRILVESADWPLAEAFARQEPLTHRVITSSDAVEGATAFVEKRPPRWSGR